MSEKALKAAYQGDMILGDTSLSVAVLEDGTRIISASAIFKAFGRTKRGRIKGEIRVHNMPELPAFIDANNLQQFISQELTKVLLPVPYLTKSGAKKSGYKAEILPLLCDVYLDARNSTTPEGKPILTKYQLAIAKSAEILIRSLSKLGIIALIDEATGYQEVRGRDELQKILKAYISEELLPWTKRFPDEFYKEMFRLNNWQYNPFTVKRPGVIGKWTNQLIYERLPKGVIDELKKQNPKNERGNRVHKHHQFLSLDIGNPHLEKQLISVITLMNVSANWRKFMELFNRKFPPPEGTQLNWLDDTDGE